MRHKMTNDELLPIILAHREDSLGVEDGQLSIERSDALDRYHGRPYGNEQEGRSHVVSKDLSDAVDWIMPAIMKVFTQSGHIASFDPVSQEDEQNAEIETHYINQVIMKDNNGWIILHDAIKDTLILKNGYVKHWWETLDKIEHVTYTGLITEEVQHLMETYKQDKAEVEIEGQNEDQITMPDGSVLPVFDLQLKISRKIGKVCIEAVPCEEIRISRKCRGSLQDSPFTEHTTVKTRSDLIEMGMDRDFVDSLPSYAQRYTNSTQSLSRDSVSDESRYLGIGNNYDHSMDEIEYCEAYIKVDFDGDGVAELRKVVTVGNKIPNGEEWNMPIPEVAITSFMAKRIPHRHVGESIFDELKDLQEIKTTLMRQLIDNVYITNNNRWAINDRVNLADMMTSLPGGVMRIEGMDSVGTAIMPIQSTPIIGQVLPVLDYIDKIKDGRTGISETTTGVDANMLKETTKGAYMENMNRATQKVEMIIRMIAETGVKELVLRVHNLLIRYQDKQRLIRMSGKYVPINPREWQERTDLSVKVGLGSGNEEDKQSKLMMMADLQSKMLGAMGLVSPTNTYNLFSEISKNLGFDNPEKYSMQPGSPEFQQAQSQQPQDPKIQVEQMKLQANQQQSQVNIQSEQAKQQAQLNADAQIAQLQNQLKMQELHANLELQASNDARDSERETSRSQAQFAIEQQKIDMEKWKTEFNGQIQLQLKQMELNSAANLQTSKQVHEHIQQANEPSIAIGIETKPGDSSNG